MKAQLPIATVLLRLGLSATFLSAVASRLGFWDSKSSGWEDFLEYTAAVNSFTPPEMIPFLGVSATVFETLFALLLIVGYKTRWASLVRVFLHSFLRWP